VAGGLLLWAAFPPLGWWPLAWVAPVSWLQLVRMKKLPGRRPYGAVFLASFLHWLLLLQGIRLAHWSTHFGWLLLTFYLAFYLPVFVGLTRVAVHRLRVPLVLAAPVVWTGLEYARGYVATGFSVALLGHSQVGWVELIQVSDLAGAYAVTFVVMFVAACLACMLPCGQRKQQVVWRPLLPAAAMIATVLCYGYVRLGQAANREGLANAVHIALIQGSIDTTFDHDPTLPQKTFDEYMKLSREAVNRHPSVDLVVWPESVFTFPLFTFDEEVSTPAGLGWTDQQFSEWRGRTQQSFSSAAYLACHELKTQALVGVQARHCGASGIRHYNTAVHIDQQGKVVGRYDKMHPVMFGEYVPLGNVFPWLYRLTPMSGGLTPGSSPTVFQIDGLRLSPSICFENTVPHLVRRQIVDLARKGKEPDVLVTLTNDGWFWGSSVLDLHLICGVFRAVEHRKPMLIAANTGFSAWIDGNGRVLRKGPRQKTGVLLAEVESDLRGSPYLNFGDWPAGICLSLSLIAALLGVVGRFSDVFSTRADA